MADNTGQACWCGALPPLELAQLPANQPGAGSDAATCYCPACLLAWRAELAAAKDGGHA
jgi:hypothetical protein